MNLPLYIYALIKLPESDLVLPTGIRSGLEVVGVSDVAAVVERGVDLEGIKENEEVLMQAVLCHDRVICELFAETVVLPLRFGSSFVSVEVLRRHLEFKRDEYWQKLCYLEAKGEFLLKIRPVEVTAVSISAEVRGKDYFLAKKQRYESSQVFQSQQADQLQLLLGLISQFYSDMKVVPGEEQLQRVYVLVKLDEEFLLKERLEGWRKQCKYWELELGPVLPPYHFVADF